MRDTIKPTAVAAIFVLGAPVFATEQPPPAELNRAQQLAFIENHLQGVPKGSRLHYDFSSMTKDMESYSDEITVTVTDLLDEEKRNLEFDFLSGTHHIDFSPAVGYTGNPVIIQFLERDIQQMGIQTGGSYGYFRNRIRNAFRQPASVRDIKFELQGKELNGIEVTVVPFTSDPQVANYEIYANKRYEFIFSDQVPGGIYRIHTLVPGKEGGDPYIDEVMTFRQLTPAT